MAEPEKDPLPLEMKTQLAERVGYYAPLTYNCAQTSFAALRDVFRLPDSGIFRAMTPLPGFDRGGDCGVTNGCLAAFGALFGDSEEDLKAGKRSGVSDECALRFCQQFVAEYSSLKCAEILTHAIGSARPPDNPAAAAEWSSRMEKSCTAMILGGVQIAARIILEHSQAVTQP